MSLFKEIILFIALLFSSTTRSETIFLNPTSEYSGAWYYDDISFNIYTDCSTETKIGIMTIPSKKCMPSELRIYFYKGKSVNSHAIAYIDDIKIRTSTYENDGFNKSIINLKRDPGINIPFTEEEKLLDALLKSGSYKITLVIQKEKSILNPSIKKQIITKELYLNNLDLVAKYNREATELVINEIVSKKSKDLLLIVVIIIGIVFSLAILIATITRKINRSIIERKNKKEMERLNSIIEDETLRNKIRKELEEKEKNNGN